MKWFGFTWDWIHLGKVSPWLQVMCKEGSLWSSKVLGIQPKETGAELAFLPPQQVESFMFLRADEGVELGFSHLCCSGFFPCSRSEPIVCCPTWHAWGIKAFQMMRTNVDNYSCCQTMEMTQCCADLSENLMKIRCVGQDFSHFRNLSLKISVLVTMVLPKITQVCEWRCLDVAPAYSHKELGFLVGLGLEEQGVFQSHLQVRRGQTELSGSCRQKGISGISGAQRENMTWAQTRTCWVCASWTSPWLMGGGFTNITERGWPAFARGVCGKNQPGLDTPELLLGAGSKTRGEFAFAACTGRETCHSLFSDLPHHSLLNVMQLRAGDCKYFPQIWCFPLLLLACLTEQPATAHQHCGKEGDLPPR